MRRGCMLVRVSQVSLRVSQVSPRLRSEPQRGGFEREAYERDMLAMKEKYEKHWDAREQQHQDQIALFKSAL